MANMLIEKNCTFSIGHNQMRVTIASMSTAMKYPPSWRLLQDIAVNPDVESIATTDMFEGGLKTLAKHSEHCIYWMLHRLIHFKATDEEGLKALKGDIQTLLNGMARACNQAHYIALKAQEELPGKDILVLFRGLFIDLLSKDTYDEELKENTGSTILIANALAMINFIKKGKAVPAQYLIQVDPDDYYENHNEHYNVLKDMDLLNKDYVAISGLISKTESEKKREKKRKAAPADDETAIRAVTKRMKKDSVKSAAKIGESNEREPEMNTEMGLSSVETSRIFCCVYILANCRRVE